MFFYFYPMNGMYAYEYGTSMGRMLMDMRAAADRHYANAKADVPYYAAFDGEPKGPYSFDEIRKMIRDGRITRDTFIWKPQMQDWDHAAQIAELQPLVCLTPPPVPAPTEKKEGEADDMGE